MSEDKGTDTHRGEGAPQIDQFVLYAERSIKLGHDCHASEGDIGIRTPLERKEGTGAAQLTIGRHTRCRNLFSPSTRLEEYSEARDVWTNTLERVEDIGIGAQHKFPQDMPELPLTSASGRSADITLKRYEQTSIGPGTYGVLSMLYESELWLAAGSYVFSAIKMDEHARIFA